ncbi:hypothetical protein TRAPUB_10657 [Trametes pubescens]|uniref:Uncharacterized protein n=1 Tax=Trametes pubescens TaxID=154538 RepID=A0A1M2VZ81_TRAPU|nr:hypothetical protein TRAPUB_10657 [Trametes pubescens]
MHQFSRFNHPYRIGGPWSRRPPHLVRISPVLTAVDDPYTRDLNDDAGCSTRVVRLDLSRATFSTIPSDINNVWVVEIRLSLILQRLAPHDYKRAAFIARSDATAIPSGAPTSLGRLVHRSSPHRFLSMDTRVHSYCPWGKSMLGLLFSVHGEDEPVLGNPTATVAAPKMDESGILRLA